MENQDPKGAPSAAERVLKAIKDALAGEKPAGEPPAKGAETPAEAATEPVEKAKSATHVVADNGTHGSMNGIHAHEHTHSDGTTHSHEHAHDGDAYHYHEHPDAKSVMKADADAAIDAKVTKIIERLDKLVDDLKAAQEKDNEISKALLDEAKVREIAKAAFDEALAPIAKAIEDLGIEAARQPRSPNFQGQSDPTKAPPAKTAEDLKGMTYADALRALLH